MVEVKNLFNENGNVKEGVTEEEINEAYDSLLDSYSKLTDNEIDEIADSLDEEAASTDKTMKLAKEQAANSDLKDSSKIESVVLNPITGTAMTTEEVNLDDDSVQSIEDLIMNDNAYDINDIDMDLFISKYAISSFFAIDPDALEKNGITDDIIKEVNTVVEKFKEYKKIDKKFSYYNAMPQPIKDQIIRFGGTNQLNMVGNMGKEARNYIAACMMNGIIECNAGEAIADDLNRSIAKMNKELSQDDMWGETRRYFSEDLTKMIAELEANGQTEQAERGKAVKESFVQSCTYKNMFDEIKSGKLKYKHIELEKFEKTCEDFNLQYKNSSNVITDVAQVLPALLRNTNITGSELLYKEFICLFIRYCRNHNLDSNNIVDHTFMYYFIQNIITLEFYNPSNESDVKFHDGIVNNIQRIIDYLSQKDADAIQEA